MWKSQKKVSLNEQLNWDQIKLKKRKKNSNHFSKVQNSKKKKSLQVQMNRKVIPIKLISKQPVDCPLFIQYLQIARKIFERGIFVSLPVYWKAQKTFSLKPGRSDQVRKNLKSDTVWRAGTGKNTRGIYFWCGKVFEGGQVTYFIYFENAFLVRSILLRNFWPRVKLWFWCVFKWFKPAFLVRILSSDWCSKT